jgi:hypothetical protein
MDSNVKGVHLGSSGQFAPGRVHVRGIYFVPGTGGSMALLDNGVTALRIQTPGGAVGASGMPVSITIPGRGVLFEGPASAQMGAVTSSLLIWVEGT